MRRPFPKHQLLRVFLILMLQLPLLAEAQKYLSGRIIDSISRSPVANATIYVDQTQVSALTDANGFFRLRSLPPNASIIVTHIAYQKAVIAAEDIGDSVLVEMIPKTGDMDNVVIKIKSKDTWKKWGGLFTEYFIGKGMEKKCELMNPEDVHFHYDKKKMLLKAWAKKPLLVRNHMLGYLVHVDLDSFYYSFAEGSFLYSVSSFFEPVAGTDAIAERAISANRLVSYNGSKAHFTRSLYASTLAPEGFSLQKYQAALNREKARVEGLLLRSEAARYDSRTENTGNSISQASFRKDSAAYYQTVMKEASYFFRGLEQVDINKRWNKTPEGNVLFYFGSDTLLLNYREPATEEWRKIKKWATIRNTSPHYTYDFIQSESGNDAYTLLYLTIGDFLIVGKNGVISNKQSLFTEGYLANLRMAYDLPWDYDPAADYARLREVNNSPALAAAGRLDSSLQQIANHHPTAGLYLHLDKTTYDHNENIWFSAYVLNAGTEEEKYQTLHVFLRQAETGKKLAAEKFVVNAGTGAGYIFLPDSLPAGSYHLVAYTNEYAGKKYSPLFNQEIVLRPHAQPFP